MSQMPQGLAALWAWALLEHERATRGVPQRTHDDFGDRDGWGDASEAIIRGLPFDKKFVRYVLARKKLDSTACRRALRRMHASGPQQSPEFWIAFAAVDAGHDLELARVLLRQSWSFFKPAAIRALTALWELTEIEIANEDRRREKTLDNAPRRSSDVNERTALPTRQ